MLKPRSYSELYNDRWDTVVNVFRVLRDPETAEKLRRALELTPYARTEFEATGSAALQEPMDAVERARRTILRSFAGFGSAATNARYATGFRANSNRAGTTPAQDWDNYPGQIPLFCSRLKGVTIENKDAAQVMLQHDGKDTLHYVDPPYVQETRNFDRDNAAYEFDMSDAEHIALAEVLRSLRGMVALSGYPSRLYEELYGDWHAVERRAFADGARERTERMWLNDAAFRKRPQATLLDFSEKAEAQA